MGASADQIKSRPSRARGLKREHIVCEYHAGGSRPSRARGLKQGKLVRVIVDAGVAPFAGAWIETWKYRYSRNSYRGRALRGRVD